jgi:hypothetical protein
MSEYTEQCALFEWALRMEGRLPVLRLLHHIPNGGKRDKITGAQLRRAGVRAGVPDNCLPVSGRYAGDEGCGLYIELKTDRGRQSKEQREWARLLGEQGHLVMVERSWWSAARLIVEYLDHDPAAFGLDDRAATGD